MRITDGMHVIGHEVTGLTTEHTGYVYPHITGFCPNPLTIESASLHGVLLQVLNGQIPTVTGSKVRCPVRDSDQHRTNRDDHSNDVTHHPELDHESSRLSKPCRE